MVTIVGVDQREDRACVGNDHEERPIPASSSSARSLRSLRPLRPAPTLSEGAARHSSDTDHFPAMRRRVSRGPRGRRAGSFACASGGRDDREAFAACGQAKPARRDTRTRARRACSRPPRTPPPGAASPRRADHAPSAAASRPPAPPRSARSRANPGSGRRGGGALRPAPVADSRPSRSARATAETHSTSAPHHAMTIGSLACSRRRGSLSSSGTRSGTTAELSQNLTAPPVAPRAGGRGRRTPAPLGQTGAGSSRAMT